MILMLAPGPNMTFGAAPSGAAYVSDQHSLVKIANNSPADQAALQTAGCYTLSPFGSWGTFGFNTLSDLYAADMGALLPGITGYPLHAIASVFSDGGNNGTWAKTSAGNGAGCWTQVAVATLQTIIATLGSIAAAKVDKSAAATSGDIAAGTTGAWVDAAQLKTETTRATAAEAAIIGGADSSNNSLKKVGDRITAEAGARDTAIATAVTNLLNGAPGALDTLKELADALGDDANFAATVTAALAAKAAAGDLTSEVARAEAAEAFENMARDVAVTPPTGLTGNGRTFADRLRGAFGHSRRARLPLALDPNGTTAFALGVDGPVFRTRVVPRHVSEKTQRGLWGAGPKGYASLWLSAMGELVGRRAVPRRHDERTSRELWGLGPRGLGAILLRADGTTSLRPSRATISRVYPATSLIRGTWRKLLAWPAARGLNGALLQEPDGTLTRGLQRTAGRYDTLLADHGSDSTQPLRVLILYGQSNCGLSGEGAPPIATSIFPHHVVGASGLSTYGVYGDTTATIGPTNFEDIVPLVDDSGLSATPLFAALTAAEGFNRVNGAASPGYLGAYVWRGGTSLDQFLPGAVRGDGTTPNGFLYTQLTTTVNGLVKAAAKYGRTVAIDFYIMQGESGPPGRSTYATMLTGLLTSISTMVQAACGRAPNFMLAQTNITEDGTSSTAPGGNDGVALGQKDVADARADTVMIGPMYPLQLHLDSGGTVAGEIHVANVDRYTFGEIVASAWAALIATGNWQCLEPNYAAVTRSGATVTIPYLLPPGALGLAFDADRVPASPSSVQGFKASLASTDSALTITAATISGSSVILTLSAAPSGPVRVRYAQKLTDAAASWTANRGQLYSPTAIPSFYRQRFGILTPNTLRHYAVCDDFTTP